MTNTSIEGFQLSTFYLFPFSVMLLFNSLESQISDELLYILPEARIVSSSRTCIQLKYFKIRTTDRRDNLNSIFTYVLQIKST